MKSSPSIPLRRAGEQAARPPSDNLDGSNLRRILERYGEAEGRALVER